MNREELGVIARDGWRLRELVRSLQTLDGGGILGLLLLPTFAFYAVEVSDWLERAGRSSGGQLLREYDPSFRGIRARLKVFDDKKLGLQGLQALMDQCDEQSVHYFNKDHTGMLGVLKRWLQDDLGLYFVGPDLVLTTHVVQAMISFLPASEKDIAAHVTASPSGRAPPNFSVLLGTFIGGVTDAFPHIEATLSAAPSDRAPRDVLRRQDAKSRHLYARMQRAMGLPTRLAAALSALISHVNFAHWWARHLLPTDDLLHFRIRYLTAIHSIEGLKRLNAAVLGNRSTPLGELSAQILRSDSGRLLRRLPSQLRNAMAHYSLPQGFQPPTSPDKLSERLVAHCSSFTFSDVDAAVDDTLQQVSTAFRGLVPLKLTAVPLDD